MCVKRMGIGRCPTVPGSTLVASENCPYLDFDRKSVTRSLSGPGQLANYAKNAIVITGVCVLDGLGWMLRTE